MRYFPDPFTGWLFLSALCGVLATATWFDEKSARIPKVVSLSALGIGLCLSCLRGGWLAAHNLALGGSPCAGIASGMLAGGLFALSGAITGFVLFFVLWLLGVCGGGDVKLVAGLGAWLGPYLIFLVLLVSLILLTVSVFVIVFLRLLRNQAPAARGLGRARGRLVIRFSLVAAAATLLVVLWAFRVDLGLITVGSSRPALEVMHGHGLPLLP